MGKLTFVNPGYNSGLSSRIERNPFCTNVISLGKMDGMRLPWHCNSSWFHRLCDGDQGRRRFGA